MFTFIHVLTTTGIRNNELCELRVGDVRYASINGMYYLHVIAKCNKDRDIPSRIDPNEPLFMTSRGNAYSPSYLNQVFKKEFSRLPAEKKQLLEEKFTYYAESIPGDKKSGIVHKVMEITLHAIKHAFAIISMKSGIHIDTIQSHLDTQTLKQQRYI